MIKHLEKYQNILKSISFNIKHIIVLTCLQFFLTDYKKFKSILNNQLFIIMVFPSCNIAWLMKFNIFTKVLTWLSVTYSADKYRNSCFTFQLNIFDKCEYVKELIVGVLFPRPFITYVKCIHNILVTLTFHHYVTFLVF